MLRQVAPHASSRRASLPNLQLFGSAKGYLSGEQSKERLSVNNLTISYQFLSYHTILGGCGHDCVQCRGLDTWGTLLLLETKSTFAFAPNNSQNPLCTWSVKTRAPSKCDLRRSLVQLRSGHQKEDQENAFIDTCSRTYVQWLGRCTWPANTYWHYSTLILGYSGEQKRVLQSLITFLFASFWQSKLPLPLDLARFLNINSLDLKAWHPLHDKELQHSIVIAPAWPQNVSLRLET